MLTNKISWLTVLAVFGMAVPAMGANIVTFRQGEGGYTSSQDTFVRRDVAERVEWNAGGAEDIGIQTSGGEIAAKIGFIEYQDIFGPGAGQVPAGQVIANATLRLFLRTELIPTSQTKPIFTSPLLIDIPDWGTSDGPAAIGEVTWRKLVHGPPGLGWGAANDEFDNGPVEGEDFDPSLEVRNNYFELEVGSFINMDVSPIVSAWYQGAITNYGFSMRPDRNGTIAQTTAGLFRSNDWGTVSQRPQLVIDYTILGDMDNSGDLNASTDLPLFIQALTDRDAYEAAQPGLFADGLGDFNGNGILDVGDLAGFSAALNAPGSASTSSVPEPASASLAAAVGIWALLGRRRRKRLLHDEQTEMLI